MHILQQLLPMEKSIRWIINNFDVIISVGYRVKSVRGTASRAGTANDDGRLVQTFGRNSQSGKEDEIEMVRTEQLRENIKELFEAAYEQYLPVTVDLCSRMATKAEVEYVLDRMLDVCGTDRMLGLFKKICRSYYDIYPDLIVSEIQIYREIYDEDSSSAGGIDA